MNHLLEFDSYAQPQANTAEGPTAQPIFGTVDFSMSGVSDDAMQLIAGLMAQAVLASGEADKIAQQAQRDPNGAASYLQNKIQGIMMEIPGLRPEFIQAMKSQAPNLAKEAKEYHDDENPDHTYEGYVNECGNYIKEYMGRPGYSSLDKPYAE